MYTIHMNIEKWPTLQRKKAFYILKTKYLIMENKTIIFLFYPRKIYKYSKTRPSRFHAFLLYHILLQIKKQLNI